MIVLDVLHIFSYGIFLTIILFPSHFIEKNLGLLRLDHLFKDAQLASGGTGCLTPESMFFPTWHAYYFAQIFRINKIWPW